MQQGGTGAGLGAGDLFPWAALRDGPSKTFGYHTLGGRYLVFCFYATAGDAVGRSVVEAVRRHRSLFDDETLCFFGVSLDPDDRATGLTRDDLPGLRFVDDAPGHVSRICGALGPEGGVSGAMRPDPFWLVVDPTLHVLARFDIGPEPDDHRAVFAFLRSLPAPRAYAGFDLPIPVLVLPNVFDQALCRRMIGLYDARGGTESGVYRDGVGVNDHAFKRRKDYTIEDPALIRHIQGVVARRVTPEIERLFFLRITRMERYIVGCYAAEDRAHFRPHRDNGPGLTAHRRFAISINLNDGFDGGEVSFPEYGPRGIKAPPGWAVVFPAAILHAVSMVTYGRRYAFLPFVYDETGAAIRDRELALHHAREAACSAAMAAEPA